MAPFGLTWFKDPSSGSQKLLLNKGQYYVAIKNDAVHISPELSKHWALKIIACSLLASFTKDWQILLFYAFYR